MEKQLTEANSRTQALKEELKKAQELLAIHADWGWENTTQSEPEKGIPEPEPVSPDTV